MNRTQALICLVAIFLVFVADIVKGAFLQQSRARHEKFRPAKHRDNTKSLKVSNDVDSNVDDLLKLLDKKTNDRDKENITKIIEKLEQAGSTTKYLQDETYVGRGGADNNNNNNEEEKGGSLLWDSYELAYFDRSIDGGRSSKAKKKKKSGFVTSVASKMLGTLFGLRYSFQHVVRPNLAVNDVGVKILGLPFSIVAGGNFTNVGLEDLDSIEKETGTRLRNDTSIRIDFEKPLLWFGTKRFPLVYRLGSAAQSPPVTLCTTYMDDRIRLAMAARGGRLVFTRKGKASEPYASDWERIYHTRPMKKRIPGGIVLASMGSLAAAVPASRVPLGAFTAIIGSLLIRGAVANRRVTKSSNNEPDVAVPAKMQQGTDVVDVPITTPQGETPSPDQNGVSEFFEKTKNNPPIEIEEDEDAEEWINMQQETISPNQNGVSKIFKKAKGNFKKNEKDEDADEWLNMLGDIMNEDEES